MHITDDESPMPTMKTLNAIMMMTMIMSDDDDDDDDDGTIVDDILMDLSDIDHIIASGTKKLLFCSSNR